VRGWISFEHYMTASFVDDPVVQPPYQGINDLATDQSPGQLHVTVMSSSRTRWRRIRSGE